MKHRMTNNLAEGTGRTSSQRETFGMKKDGVASQMQKNQSM